MTTIETRDLAKTFGALKAVDGITMSVGKGELFGLVGPDGAGKSTTIRMLCGIVTPTGGGATVLGCDTKKDKQEQEKNIAYLSQRFTLYGDLTVDENIEFFARIHAVESFAARREELLDFTRMKDARSRLADRLSGGMKQKLALACTLIHSPEVIFLDEPTTGVDPVSRRDFWKILSNLLQQGITIFMTTPYLDEAERCTRVALMNKGKLLNVDTPQNVKAKMQGEVFEIVCDPVRPAYQTIIDWKSVHEVQMYGDRLNVILLPGGKSIQDVLGYLKQHQVSVASWRPVPPRLENVFISMMAPVEEKANEEAIIAKEELETKKRS